MAKSFRLHRGAVAMNYSKILNNQHRLKGSYLTATHFMLFVSNIPGVTVKAKRPRREADLGSGGFLTEAGAEGYEDVFPAAASRGSRQSWMADSGQHTARHIHRQALGMHLWDTNVPYLNYHDN